MKKNPTTLIIPDGEKAAAAKYFALSNMALLDIKPYPNCKNLNQLYDYADGVCQSECGVGAEEERKDWEKTIKKAKPGDYVCEEWNLVKGNYEF